MAQREDLDALPTAELHDRAMRLARGHFDARFLWELLRAVPVAEASVGHIDYAEQDVTRLSGLLTDAAGVRDGAIAEVLRPMYLDYLAEHEPTG